MNQILISDKIIVTPEFRRKKKIYQINFFLSVFLACTLFSAYIYAEYDRSASEQVSQEILLGLKTFNENEEEEYYSDTISVEDGILYVTINENPQNESREVDISTLMAEYDSQRTEERTKIVESVADDGTRYYTESILRIDKIGLEYPVLSDTSDELLKISLNKLWGPKPNTVGNYVIIGHNYKTGKMFGRLKELQIGDTFTLEDLTGRVVTYKIYNRYVIDPTDVSCTSQLTDGQKEVTLVTCTSAGAERLVFKALEVKNGNA